MGVARSERNKQEGGGPIVIGARRRERAHLLRMRLVELDGCEIRMNAKDIETNSIRVPDATLQALASKNRTLLLQDPIYIVAGFQDPMVMVSDVTKESRCKPHWTQFARILYVQSLEICVYYEKKKKYSQKQVLRVMSQSISSL